MPPALAHATPDRPLPAAEALTLADVGQLALRLQQAGQADAAVALYRQWLAGGPLPMRPGASADPRRQPVPPARPTGDEGQPSFHRAVRRAAEAARQGFGR